MKKVLLLVFFSVIIFASIPTKSNAGLVNFFEHIIYKLINKETKKEVKVYIKNNLPNIHPKWKNTHLKGKFGDYITAKRMTAMGYTKLKSKISSIHGFDGVYIKKDKYGNIKEIIITENKVDSAHLNPGPPRQMSWGWVEKNIQKMLNSNDENVRKTGEILKRNKNKIKLELWKHDTKQGKTIVYLLDKNGNIVEKYYEWNDRMIFNNIYKKCSKEEIECY